MSDLAATALLGVDWGTSSLRVVAMDVSGKVLNQVSAPRGIQTVADGEFAQTLESLLAPWQVAPAVPVVLSGMVTSRNGWVETPYLPVPAALESLAAGLVARVSPDGRQLYFVPGLSQGGASGDGLAVHADVMRGEETEMLGWLMANKTDARAGSGQFVLPGTHSKWATLSGRQVDSFSTCMTGEVFQALSQHTILNKLMSADGVSDEAFCAGARVGLNEPGRLLSHCFSVRALPLLGGLAVEQTRDYLAGLLIGAEVGGQLDAGAGTLVVIGRGDLADRYVRVMQMAGRQARVAPPGSAAHGQFALARQAGLV